MFIIIEDNNSKIIAAHQIFSDSFNQVILILLSRFVRKSTIRLRTRMISVTKDTIKIDLDNKKQISVIIQIYIFTSKALKKK